MRRLLLAILFAAAAFAGLVFAAELGFPPLLITHEGEKKLVLTLGSPGEPRDPGLWFWLPLLQTAETYDVRAHDLNTAPLPIQTKDGERLVVDNYVVWRIADVIRYRESFPSGRVEAESRIDRVVRADVREEIGQRTLEGVLTTERVEVMNRITNESAKALANVGVEILDVRINRTDLPEGTLENVYGRMRAERERLARQKRAEGEEERRRIRAEADRLARVTVAEAQRDAEILMGQGDAEAARIYAKAYSTDPEFYYFVRRLEAYRKTIGEGTTLVLPPSHEFFRLFESSDIPLDSEPPPLPPVSSAGDAGQSPGADGDE